MSTRLTRDLRATAWAAGIAVVAAALAYGAYRHGGVVGWIGVIVLGFVALMSLGVAVVGKSATCPGCGKKHAGVANSEDISQCIACRAYLVTRGREIALVPDDYIHERPRFSVEVSTDNVGAFRLPKTCCVCCAPSTRVDEMLVRDSKTLENILATAIGSTIGAPFGIGMIQSGGHGQYWIPAPYCATCPTDGVEVVTHARSLELQFRSLRFARQVGELNRLPTR